ncbi:MAG TPA: N-acyl homoserine lactonase family protein [Burkholderiaceae bacterium]|jgi:N-acyl homoserine lactone hydrolase|nr:N-acyl homoserine lactonase family protein [Burkholderiaceae bacterium]
MASDYSIWTFCFAKGRLPADFVGGTPVMSNRGTVPIPMVYSAIAPAGHVAGAADVVLIDTGFRSGRSMTGRNFDDFETPQQTLAKVGLTPQEVGTIVLTHLHFDHAGNLDAFPQARVLVQRRELEHWRRVLSRFEGRDVGREVWALSSINRGDFDVLQRIDSEGRLHLLDGDAEIAPGIACRLAADTHTFGSQWLVIRTADGPFILAGDCAYWYANIETMWPPGYLQGNPWNMLATYEQMLEVVGGDLNRIVVGHDMQIFERHRSEVIGSNPFAAVHVAAAAALTG